MLLLLYKTTYKKEYLVRDENVMNDKIWEFKKYLKTGETDSRFDLLYTQMLNGKRIQDHKVVYVFDEVGCGKTISAIIAMASIIWKKKNTYKILVLTECKVCPQFTAEINERLNVDPKNIWNIAGNSGEKLDDLLEEISSEEKYIVVSNYHENKLDQLQEILKTHWDLIIIDEAQNIICNSWKQTEVYYTDKINKAYDTYLAREDFPEYRKQKIINYLGKINKSNPLYENIQLFVKHLAVEEYNDYLSQKNAIEIPASRKKDNVKFKEILKLRADRLMYLSATPWKNSQEMDFMNYSLVASKILTGALFSCDFLPELDWIQDVYTAQNNGKQKMEEANASYIFKEIALAIPFEEKNIKSIGKKQRIVEIWDEKAALDNNLLRNKIFNKLKEKNIRNRFIIFVSNSWEGEHIFKKIFPDSSINILENHLYENNGISCQFIMNKLKNTEDLQKYSKENENIPDILIVTWQVAQVGINLPTYNHVINYHIPSVPGYLEQRFGRIDRLNSSNNTLYNIYYLENSYNTYIYRINLINALNQYIGMIMGMPHNLPTKNLLFCSDLKIKEIPPEKINEEKEELYKALAYHIAYYLSFAEEAENNKLLKLRELLNGTEWKDRNIKWDGKENLYIGKIAYHIVNLPKNDEEIVNSDLKQDTIEDNIKSLSKYLKQVEDCNQIATQINNSIDNSDELAQPGSIIFWDSKKNSIIMDIDNIVKKLI